MAAIGATREAEAADSLRIRAASCATAWSVGLFLAAALSLSAWTSGAAAAGSLTVSALFAAGSTGPAALAATGLDPRCPACAQEASRFAGLHDLLCARRPQSDDAWSPPQILPQLASRVIGLDAATFHDWVSRDAFSPWVSAVQDEFDRSSCTSTPTVLLNGVPACPTCYGAETTPAQIAAWAAAIDGVAR